MKVESSNNKTKSVVDWFFSLACTSSLTSVSIVTFRLIHVWHNLLLHWEVWYTCRESRSLLIRVTVHKVKTLVLVSSESQWTFASGWFCAVWPWHSTFHTSSSFILPFQNKRHGGGAILAVCFGNVFTFKPSPTTASYCTRTSEDALLLRCHPTLIYSYIIQYN